MRTLKVKCPTWDQVETFYTRKLRRGNTLSVRVPFVPEQGSSLTLGLELPNDMVMAIDGTIIAVKPAPEGGQSAIQISLHGMTAEVRRRLATLVARGRDAAEATAPPAHGEDSPVPPAPRPADAPIDELVEDQEPPSTDDIGEYERGVFDNLQAELARLRESAAHEVLGVPANAGLAAIRGAYFARTKQYHPDLFTKYRSDAIGFVAQELFIFINRAYDRMRNAFSSAGTALMAGPALLAQDGWLARLDDIEDDVAAAPQAAASAQVAEGDPRLAELERAARARMAENDLDGAREQLAEALQLEPRNRRLRALFHVCSGRAALAAGRPQVAASQFETALAHDRECAEARGDLDALRAEHGSRTSGVFRRFFR